MSDLLWLCSRFFIGFSSLSLASCSAFELICGVVVATAKYRDLLVSAWSDRLGWYSCLRHELIVSATPPRRQNGWQLTPATSNRSGSLFLTSFVIPCQTFGSCEMAPSPLVCFSSPWPVLAEGSFIVSPKKPSCVAHEAPSDALTSDRAVRLCSSSASSHFCTSPALDIHRHGCCRRWTCQYYPVRHRLFLAAANRLQWPTVSQPERPRNCRHQENGSIAFVALLK